MKVSYDEFSDVLAIQKTAEEPSERLEMGQIILDMSQSNEVRGLEIRKASSFFKACKEEMRKAKDADLYTLSTSLMLEITLKTKKCLRPSRIAVPIELP